MQNFRRRLPTDICSTDFLSLYIHKHLHSGDVGLGEGFVLAGGEVLELDDAGLDLVATVDGKERNGLLLGVVKLLLEF